MTPARPLTPGQPFEAFVSEAAEDVVALGHGRFQIGTGTRRTLAYAASAGRSIWVFLDGRAYVFNTGFLPKERRASQADDAVALAAPMPATVVALNVSAGQVVRQGDVLVTLEAMKMELAVRAPRDANVKRINCRLGELVQAGTALIELD